MAAGVSAVTVQLHTLADSAKLILDLIHTESENVTTFQCGTLTALGTTQGTAAAITSDTVAVTTTGVGQGVILPAGCFRVLVRQHAGANQLAVYPPTGAKLGALAANLPLAIALGGAVLFCQVNSTQWDYVALS